MLVRKCLYLLVTVSAAASAMSVSLSPSVDTPAPLGTLVTFTAMTAGADAGALSYRFRTRYTGAHSRRHALDPDFRTVVDYGPKSTFDWTTIEHEGSYEVEASVKNSLTGETARSTTTVAFTRLAAKAAPVVRPTAHPLVFIYSAPECPDGGRMRVRFQSADGVARNTPWLACDSRFTRNFYLAGMRSNTAFSAKHTVETRTGASIDGPAVSFTTGGVAVQAPVAMPLSTPVPSDAGILLQSVINSRPIATDLNGNLLWFGPEGLSLLTRANSGGTFLAVHEDGSQPPAAQFVREFDLAGVTLAETNAARVNEQLVTMSVHSITSFHHEAIRLPDGKYLVLAGSERILTGVQGDGPIDVLGDTILVLDRNLQVLWAWDAFDHLDPGRAATLQETCSYPATLACSTFYGAGNANDWLHGNGLQLTPDGNILYSVRHQDWVVKIDYRNGAGTGDILWRLGRDGDFTLTSGDSTDWFSHQHDPQFLADNRTLLLFDNGNTRIADNNGDGASRGQVWLIDDQARTATVMMNAGLRVNSSALGTAQLLANGHFHFDAGFFPDPAHPPARISQALEVDAGGNIVWGMQIYAQEYRSFRLNDLYTPPLP